MKPIKFARGSGKTEIPSIKSKINALEEILQIYCLNIWSMCNLATGVCCINDKCVAVMKSMWEEEQKL